MEPSTEPNLDILNALFIQLTEGCGSIHCRCIHCFSSKSFVHKNKNPEEIIKWMKSNTKYMCSSICPALYKRKIVKNSYNFEKFIKSKMFFGNISRFVSYIDSKEKFCSLFWGLSTFSKKNYNFDEKFICSFINDTQNLKSKLLTDVIKQRVIDICISDYSHYNQRGLFVFFAFSHLLTYSQFIVMFLRIVKFVQKGPRNHVHDLYYIASKYCEFLEKVVGHSQKILTTLSKTFTIRDSEVLKSLVKHISYLSEANEISSTPIPYIKFQNEEFTNLLDPESEVLKMLQGEFSYISKSNLLTLKFKKAVNQCESQILMILCEEGPKSYLHFVIRRDHLLQDTITQLKMIQPSELMKQIHVTFVGEEGRDQGGVSKEFFSLISKEIFSTKHFEKYQNFIFFNSNADNISHNHDLDNICQFYEYYELCGKLIGIAIHNSIIIPVRFPQLLYKMLRKSMIRLGDLEEIKPEVIQSLKSILCLKERADFNALSLFFDVTIFDEKENIVKTVPLIKNGSQIQVNENNVDMYVIEMKRFILKAYNNVFNHFKKGFWDAIGSKTLRMFTDEELDIIISGQWEYDWKGFRDSTCYTSGYTKKSETIQMFWEVFENDLDENQKKEFLLFVTGSKISPVEGLSGLGFIISRSGDINLLPVSHTCFNVFQLPDYKDINLIRKNLQICINNNEGFGFI